MSYGVTLEITYTETSSTGSYTERTSKYSFHVDTANGAKNLINETAENAKKLNAVVKAVQVTEEKQNSNNPYRNLSDSEILELLLTK